MENKEYDFFDMGKWTKWLRGFKEGEEQLRYVDPIKMRSIRVRISQQVKNGLYFKTITDGHELWIKRLSYQEWLEDPHRKLFG